LEEILSGQAAGDLEDKDLNELLQIARIRMDASRSMAQAGAQFEGTLWQQVIDRLHRSPQEKPDAPAGIPDWLLADTANASVCDPEELDIQQLQDIISLRHQMAERAASLAESHRDAVWSQLQARIESRRRGLFAALRGSDAEIKNTCSAVDSLILGEPIWESGDSRLAELLHLAKSRRAAAQATRSRAADVQGRVWARIRPRLLSRLLSPLSSSAGERSAPAWPKLAAAAAALAVVLAALGPLPATGFAEHPIAQLVRLVGEHVGTTGTAPPPLTPPTRALEGSDVSTAQASRMLGLPVAQPAFVPPDFRLVSSRFFPQALTAAQGGTYLLAYASSAGTATPVILIYQERADGSDIAVRPGSAQDFVLPDGTPGTYITGSWRPAASGDAVVWSDESAQTLVFDRQGVRTIIQYRGGAGLDEYELQSVAASLAASR
ncbi:MAG TPA: hypothetical protein VFT91_06040, partial [Dehalococcoidia bacterium]|nr:hypothetical protein [Dehalococcoidia bacterium]